MLPEFLLTEKQAEYIRNMNHRWNVSSGAVRSGKSHLQIAYIIPSRLLERKGKRGLRVILGATRANIERNILQPMRDIFGESVATSINSQNYAKILGEKVYCIGADNVRQVAKIRGSEIAYCAVDEATDLNKEVFEMLKSRLSLPWSCCDITTNPSTPSHWFKEFLNSKDKGVDIYLQEYTIYDNPFLPKEYVAALEAEYRGTVWFDRYILGKWALAEGLIYPMFTLAKEKRFEGMASEYALSIDYGTQNAFAALLWAREGTVWHVIHEYRYSGRDVGRQKTDEDYVRDMEKFIEVLPEAVVNYGHIFTIIDPSAASFIEAMLRSKRKNGNNTFSVFPADNGVLDGIRDVASCIQRGVIKISEDCKETFKEFEGYAWDTSESEDKPIKINDHMMDALRYFVRTKRLAVPLQTYKSKFGGR